MKYTTRGQIIGGWRFEKVGMKDADFLYELRSEPTARQFLLQTGDISYEDHLKWLVKAIEDTDRLYYLVSVNQVPIGTIRADKRDNDYWELAYLISKNHRGKGYGTSMLELAQRFKFPDLKLMARVQRENIASRRMVENIGMRQTQTSEVMDGRIFDCFLIESLVKEETHQKCVV